MGEARAIPSSSPPATLIERPERSNDDRAGGGGNAWAPWLRWLAVIVWALGMLALARSLSPSLDVEPRLAFLSGFAAVALSAVLTAAACPPIQPRALIGLAFPAAALLALAFRPAPDLTGALIVTAALLAAASLVGGAVGRAIEHPGQLVFVAVVSAAADAASVFHPSGPSAAMAQSKAALSLVALPWPMLGTPAIEPLLGVGDVVFTALYLASARRHGLPWRRTMVALLLAYGVTAALVLVLETAVPALPLLGLAVVLAHPEARRPRVADRQRGVALSIAAVLGVAALLVFGR
ncbi:MAG TPA: hypothetical protein VK509_17240 [Polyangiales bacterium]|nr:hypothetical protein [Polyangiales bacterium]